MKVPHPSQEKHDRLSYHHDGDLVSLREQLVGTLIVLVILLLALLLRSM